MFIQETAQHGGRIEVVKKRLGKGWKGDFGPVNAYEIKNARVILGLDLDTKNDSNANTVIVSP